MSRKIRTLIVDDEPLARTRIRTLLADRKDVELCGECSSGQSAVSAIREFKPDLVFLDVQMPEMDGFEVIRSVGIDLMPVIIFVTAYDEYAVRAFEAHALDYLLKPFSPDRFDKAFRRAVREISQQGLGELSHQLRELIDSVADRRKLDDRILVKSSGRVYLLKIDQIDWIESAGNYVNLHVGRATYLLRETMRGMERRLTAFPFVRIHRKTLVNVNRIKELRALDHGNYDVLMAGGAHLVLSRRYRHRLGDFERLIG